MPKEYIGDKIIRLPFIRKLKFELDRFAESNKALYDFHTSTALEIADPMKDITLFERIK
jgi:hypothetical protein